MKRYLYILFIAVVALTSCEPFLITEPTPDIGWYFGDINATTTENSATISSVKPYVTIDGEIEANTTISLKYWVEGQESSVQTIDKYNEENGFVTFVVEGLTPDTSYQACVAIAGKYGEEVGGCITFKTQKHIPVAEFSCDCEVDAKGVLAYVTLDNVSFKLDGVESPLAKVEFKYYQMLSGGEKVVVEVSAEQLAEGFRIPAEGEEYLSPESTYSYSVTLTPQDATIESYTINGRFETVAAELSALISEPVVEAVGSNITLDCEIPTLMVDGVAMSDYGVVEYQFYYSDNNADSAYVDADVADGRMTWSAPLSRFREGVTYNFRSVMSVNDSVMESADVTFTMPLPEIPTPPAPPVSGDADTSALAGDWHLTQWRGSEPSFDVYLSISDDGVVSLYQRIASRLWETFYSTVSYENGVIAGLYTDGVAWAHSYNVVVAGDTMTWTSTMDSSEVSVYTRSTLPDVTNPEIMVMSECGKRFL